MPFIPPYYYDASPYYYGGARCGDPRGGPSALAVMIGFFAFPCCVSLLGLLPSQFQSSHYLRHPLRHPPEFLDLWPTSHPDLHHPQYLPHSHRPATSTFRRGGPAPGPKSIRGGIVANVMGSKGGLGGGVMMGLEGVGLGVAVAVALGVLGGHLEGGGLGVDVVHCQEGGRMGLPGRLGCFQHYDYHFGPGTGDHYNQLMAALCEMLF